MNNTQRNVKNKTNLPKQKPKSHNNKNKQKDIENPKNSKSTNKKTKNQSTHQLSNTQTKDQKTENTTSNQLQTTILATSTNNKVIRPNQLSAFQNMFDGLYVKERVNSIDRDTLGSINNDPYNIQTKAFRIKSPDKERNITRFKSFNG